MSKLSIECERISTTDKQPENPYKIEIETSIDLQSKLLNINELQNGNN